MHFRVAITSHPVEAVYTLGLEKTLQRTISQRLLASIPAPSGDLTVTFVPPSDCSCYHLKQALPTSFSALHTPEAAAAAAARGGRLLVSPASGLGIEYSWIIAEREWGG